MEYGECNLCRYWQKEGHRGHCKRYAPRPNYDAHPSTYDSIKWPLTSGIEGCWEWVKKA